MVALQVDIYMGMRQENGDNGVVARKTSQMKGGPGNDTPEVDESGFLFFLRISPSVTTLPSLAACHRSLSICCSRKEEDSKEEEKKKRRKEKGAIRGSHAGKKKTHAEKDIKSKR